MAAPVLAAPLFLGDLATMVSASVEAAALATCSSFCDAVGERRVGSVTSEQVKRLLTQVELFSKDNNQLNWHVHVSGYDCKGKLFWLPIYEDDAVLQSAAANILGQVYRYVESRSCMEATATSIMTQDPRPLLPTIPFLRTAPPVTLPPGSCRSRDVVGDAITDVRVGDGSHAEAGPAATGGDAGGALVDARDGSVLVDPWVRLSVKWAGGRPPMPSWQLRRRLRRPLSTDVATTAKIVLLLGPGRTC